MKILDIAIKLIILSFTSSIVGAETNIPYRDSPELPNQIGNFEHSILTPNRFQMNQSFSLSTSVIGNTNQTTGIYSNFTRYRLSEKMDINAGIHLIQSQNNLNLSSKPQMGIGYELDLEYRLNPNSILSFHIINYNHTPLINPYRFNAP